MTLTHSDSDASASSPPDEATDAAPRPRILVVDDEPDFLQTLSLGLEKRGYVVSTAPNMELAREKLEDGPFDAVLCDLKLDGNNSGLSLCRRVQERRPDLPVVMMTGFGSFESAVEAVRAGAYDYVTKPIDMGPLGLILDRAVRHHRLQVEVRQLRSRDREHTPSSYGGIVGDSPAMRRMYDLLRRIEDSDVPVLVLGESGTGKELVARALHRQGARADQPFVAINTAAVPATLLESTLFGHVRGAFTDAKQARAGLFVEANGGTLFLDEVGEMPLEMQAKLLRVLQERKVRPVGGTVEVPFDVRIICATNRDLEDEVEKGNFREDLFYRINVVSIRIPPLRSRGSDIMVLAQHFLESIGARTGKNVRGFDLAAAKKITDYDWPGNVRELENSVERAMALTRGEVIEVDDLPQRIVSHVRRSFSLASDDDVEKMAPLSEVERRYVERVLEASSGNKTLAARVLGLDRRTLYRKLHRWSEEARGERGASKPPPSS
ncbi:MAG: sigma-54 dependent transcriptional regulator [Myxococcota bacterium]